MISQNYLVTNISPPVKSVTARVKASSLILGSSILKETFDLPPVYVPLFKSESGAYFHYTM